MDRDRIKKYGVAARNLKELIEKASQKFNFKSCKLYLSSDGTLVDDQSYFESIPAQTLFIVAENDEGNVKTGKYFQKQFVRHEK